jgi:restriction endonuclease Mrr
VAIELNEHERSEVGRKARAAVLSAVRTLGGEGLRSDILQLARREGHFSHRELCAAAPERARANYNSLVDHRLSWALTDLKRGGLLENPKRGVWCLAGEALLGPTPLAEEVSSAERLAQLRTMPTRKYLRTSEWRRTRAAALARANHCCSLDRTHTGQLDVHHNTYERVGAELPADLVVLCHSCHELHHEAYGLPRRSKSDPRAGGARHSGSAAPPGLASAAHVRAGSGTSGRKRSLLRRLLASS